MMSAKSGGISDTVRQVGGRPALGSGGIPAAWRSQPRCNSRRRSRHLPVVDRSLKGLPPNGSRLSCGRNARRRKEVEPQTKRLAGEATQFFPQEAPVSFKRLLGGSGTVIQNTNHVCVRDFVRPVLTRDELYEPKEGRERLHQAPKPDAP